MMTMHAVGTLVVMNLGMHGDILLFKTPHDGDEYERLSSLTKVSSTELAIVLGTYRSKNTIDDMYKVFIPKASLIRWIVAWVVT